MAAVRKFLERIALILYIIRCLFQMLRTRLFIVVGILIFCVVIFQANSLNLSYTDSGIFGFQAVATYYDIGKVGISTMLNLYHASSVLCMLPCFFSVTFSLHSDLLWSISNVLLCIN
jgi:hypothetical protein